MSKITIRSSKPSPEGDNVEIMEIIVDSVADLPAKDYFPGRIIGHGSVAWCINDGIFCGMNSEGEWISQGEW